MWRKQFEKQIAEYEIQIRELQGEIEKWKRRAYQTVGQIDRLEKENARLVADNRALAEKIVDVATRPATVIPAPEVKVSEILEGIRRIVSPIVSPDVIIRQGPDSADEQRSGVDWGAQGLDNNGGVKEYGPDDIDSVTRRGGPPIPEYVLDIERLTEDQIREGRGGWYNPSTKQATPGGN